MSEQKPKEPTPLAEDVAYTVNHALACTATDILNPYIGNITQRYLGKRVNVGCRDHDHNITLPPENATAEQKADAVKELSKKKFGKGLFTKLEISHSEPDAYKRLQPVVPAAQSNLKHWWVGEIVGDFGAVPITVAAQRMLPGLMDSIRSLTEPVLGPLFRIGAKRDARIWAEHNNVEVGSKEYKEHEKDTYAREMRHLPQAFMWTASSVALNIGAQRISGNKGELSHLLAGKAVGAATSAAAVLGFRSLAPHQAYKWDQFTSEYIFRPTAHVVKKAVNGESWKERVEAAPESTRQI